MAVTPRENLVKNQPYLDVSTGDYFYTTDGVTIFCSNWDGIRDAFPHPDQQFFVIDELEA